MIEPADVARLVRLELDRVADPTVASAIERLLVPPRREDRGWDYGPNGQRFACWIILEHPPSKTGIAYCTEGFGPGSPWGLLYLDTHSSMGMDSGWFTSLEDAFRDSMAWDR